VGPQAEPLVGGVSPSFTIGRLPRVEFGPGRLDLLPTVVSELGHRALLVTGSRSFRQSPRWGWLLEELGRRGIAVDDDLVVSGEPSPDLVDEAVARHRGRGIDVVVGIGGGSVLDTAKAVAGLLQTTTSVMDHLEVVGRGVPYQGPAVPFVAVPTTAGTGSEATRNAVLSRRGPGGFKRSFRDERLVARVAIVDPDLLASCPPALVAADGMDAVSQLLESYVSQGASPFTDALALAGLEAAVDALPTWYGEVTAGRPDSTTAVAARTAMAFASLASGICLAHAGLGAVHGLAAPLGGLTSVPHGVACGLLLAPVVRANVAAMTARAPRHPALARYHRLGRLLARRPDLDDGMAVEALVGLFADWRRRFRLPGLAAYGLTRAQIPAVVAASRGGSMRTNPIELTDEELTSILEDVLE
jgi:alcohol dehydrogenase class IV